MSDPSPCYWVAYNGEVYNDLELRRELTDLGCQFRTDSDTEVALQSWIVWGFAALARLSAGYAFGIHDAREHSFTLVRDRFGKRPLFYARHRTGWLCASETKAFSVVPGWRFAWDAKALRTLFACRTPLPDDGCYQGVRQALPGCCIRFCNEQILKSALANRLPPEIAARPKQPYRAPDAPAFLELATPVDEIDAALLPAELATIEVLELETSRRFLDMIRRKPPDRLSQAENQAFVLLLSLSLLNRSLVRQGHDFRQPRLRRLPCTIHDRRSQKASPGTRGRPPVAATGRPLWP